MLVTVAHVGDLGRTNVIYAMAVGIANDRIRIRASVSLFTSSMVARAAEK